MSNFSDISKYINDCAELVNAELKLFLSDSSDDTQVLIDAMQYAVLSGGKRLRPFFLISCADLLGVSRAVSLRYACALELIHCYSLVHDDLPGLDNDDFRRSIPSCHKKFNEGVAILCGDALLTKAFEIMSVNDGLISSDIALKIINKVAIASGIKGMIGGQVMDIVMPRDSSIENVMRMERMKTGALFVACAEIANILSLSASKKQKDHLLMYAKSIGSAFQIADDLSDYKEKKDEVNIAQIIGVQGAKDELVMLVSQAEEMLNVFDEKKALILRKFTQYFISKA